MEIRVTFIDFMRGSRLQWKTDFKIFLFKLIFPKFYVTFSIIFKKKTSIKKSLSCKLISLFSSSSLKTHFKKLFKADDIEIQSKLYVLENQPKNIHPTFSAFKWKFQMKSLSRFGLLQNDFVTYQDRNLKSLLKILCWMEIQMCFLSNWYQMSL